MPGHFAPLDVVFSYPESPLARGSYSSWLYFLILTVLYLHADKSPTRADFHRLKPRLQQRLQIKDPVPHLKFDLV